MRRSGTAKQRVWVGPGRYRGRRRDAFTNRDAVSYANSNRYAFCMRAGKPDAYSHSNSYAYTDSYAYSHSNSYAYTDSYAYGDSDSYAYADSYAYGDNNSDAYCNLNTWAEAYSDAASASDATAPSVGPDSEACLVVVRRLPDYGRVFSERC